jgi:hypothetical protein
MSEWGPPMWRPGKTQREPLPGIYEDKATAVLKMGCAIALGIVFLAVSIGVAIVVLKVARG